MVIKLIMYKCVVILRNGNKVNLSELNIVYVRMKRYFQFIDIKKVRY